MLKAESKIVHVKPCALKVVPLKRTSNNSHFRKPVKKKRKLLSLAPDPGTLERIKDLVFKVSTRVETKEPVRVHRSLDSPTEIHAPHVGYRLVDTENLLGTFARLFLDSDRTYRFRMSTAVNLVASGAGFINSVAACGTLLSGISEFSSISTLFNEFYLAEMDLQYEPNSLYNYPLTGVTATSVASLPIAITSLQHAQSAPTTIALATNNYQFKLENTGRRWRYKWINSDPITSPAEAIAATAFQGWGPTASASAMTGSAAFISQLVTPPLVATCVVGLITVHFDVYVRQRE